jgi:hypothetical protein
MAFSRVVCHPELVDVFVILSLSKDGIEHNDCHSEFTCGNAVKAGLPTETQ